MSDLRAVQKCENLVGPDFFKMDIDMQKSASIQPRTSPPKYD